MNFSLYIAKRYLLSKKGSSTISIITGIATMGIIVVSAALFVVLSGFLGLKNFSLQFLNASDPDIKISSSRGKSFMVTDSIIKLLKNDKNIVAYSKVIEERAFFEYHKKTHIAYLKGVDTNYSRINQIDTTVVRGSWLDADFPKGVVVGSGIAGTLSVGIFNYDEPLKIYVPKPGKGYISNPKNSLQTVHTQPIGIYRIIDEIDYKFTFSSLPLAQQLLGYDPKQISAIEIKIAEGSKENEIAKYLQKSIGNKFKVKTRKEQNVAIYKMLNTENLILYLVFTLIVIIALFNALGAIIMIILDKQSSITTLYNLGAPLKSIRNIFTLQGFLLTLFGLFVGLFIGISLVFIQKKYQLFMITQSIPYPVEFSFTNLAIVVATITLLGFITAKIASRKVFP